MKKNIVSGRQLAAQVVGFAVGVLLATTVSAQTLPNGSFEANTFSLAPGTISVNGPITGWTVGDPAKAGLNPAGGVNTYANNGTVPHGTNVLFLQPTNYASTVLSGLTVGTDYSLRFRVNAPVGGAPTLRVALDNEPSIFDAGGVMPVAAAGVAAPWKYVALNFKATASEQTLYVSNNAAGLANVLLLDDFKINVSTSGWSVAMWTNDASAGVDNTKVYTHAYAFNTTGAGFSISNVTFSRLGGANPTAANGDFSSALGAATTDAANVLRTAGGGSAILASQFAYNGNPAVLVFNNLIPGREYVSTFYTVGWDAAGKVYGRSITWDAGGDRLSVNQNHFGENVGTVMSYRYRAPASGFMVFSNFPFSTTAGTLHTYGAANYEVTSFNEPVIGVQPTNKVSIPGSGAGFYVTTAGAGPLGYQWLKDGVPMPDRTNRFLSITNLGSGDLAQYSVVVTNSFGAVTSSSAGITFSTAMIPNPSFEGETFTVFPGYASANFPIPGWFVSNPSRAGISLAGGTSPFVNNGTPPDGRNAAFLQNAGGGSNWLSTIITGLTPGQRYTLDFGANARAGQFPYLRVNAGGELVAEVRLSSVGGVGMTAPYRRIAVDFTPTNETMQLYLTNNAPGDTTAVLDDFRITPSVTKWKVDAWTNDASSGVDNTKFYTHAFNFGSRSDALINGVTFRGTPGVNPSIPNLYTTSGFGLEFAGPDLNVLTTEGGGSASLAQQFLYGGPIQSITLTNLVPGVEYVATIFSVGFDAAGKTFGRTATFQVGADRITINQNEFGDNAGIRVSYPYTADASGSITISYIPTDSGSTFHTYGFANYQLTGTAPVIAAQPASAFVPASETVSLSVALSAGAQPTTYQWQADGVNIADQTNATLVLSNLVLGSVSNYRVVVSNSFGSVTSVVASVEAGVKFTELFNTGVDDNNVFLPGGVIDSHYQLVASDDPLYPGPNAVTMHNGAFPLLANYFTNGLFSSWISPLTNSTVGNVAGFYTYRTSFILDSVDPTRAQINGRWASDNEGIEIRLNGVPTGISNMVSGAFTTFYPFTITNGFVAGSNVLEFVIYNGPASGPTALRVEMTGVGRPLATSVPQITSQPQNVLGQEGGAVSFTVLATGSPTLKYQWFYEGIDLPNEDKRTLKLTGISKFDQSGSYWVVVDNGVAAVESAHVTLTINSQPVAGDDSLATGSNQPITFAASKLLANDGDAPEDDALSIVAVSPVSTNSGTVSLVGGLITYSPLAGYTGSDQFTYTLGDARGGRATGTVSVNVGATNFLSVVRPAALLPNGHFQVGYMGVAGYLYTVERSTNILGPWQVFTNITADVNGLFQIDDPNTPPAPTRFYRVKYP